jgi:hypothetical protein
LVHGKAVLAPEQKRPLSVYKSETQANVKLHHWEVTRCKNLIKGNVFELVEYDRNRTVSELLIECLGDWLVEVLVGFRGSNLARFGQIVCRGWPIGATLTEQLQAVLAPNYLIIWTWHAWVDLHRVP